MTATKPTRAHLHALPLVAADYRERVKRELDDLPGPGHHSAVWMLETERLAEMGLELDVMDEVEVAFLVAIAARDTETVSAFLSVVHRAAGL
jgi:hypothetical protein